MHGWGGSQAQYLARAREIAALGCVCLTFDLRGHGKSAVPKDGDYAVESFVKDLEAVVEKLRLERFVLVGHSLGGAVAVKYASTLRSWQNVMKNWEGQLAGFERLGREHEALGVPAAHPEKNEEVRELGRRCEAPHAARFIGDAHRNYVRGAGNYYLTTRLRSSDEEQQLYCKPLRSGA